MQVSSTKRIPLLTKNDTDATTSTKRSGSTCPEACTASSTSTAVARAIEISCTGVAPASWRWYEQMLIGFHRGTSRAQKAMVSTMSRRDGSGGKMWVPRLRYSLTMSFWVVPRSAARATPCVSAWAT